MAAPPIETPPLPPASTTPTPWVELPGWLFDGSHPPRRSPDGMLADQETVEESGFEAEDGFIEVSEEFQDEWEEPGQAIVPAHYGPVLDPFGLTTLGWWVPRIGYPYWIRAEGVVFGAGIEYLDTSGHLRSHERR